MEESTDRRKGTIKMRFVFQGDSITDALRTRQEDPKELGTGYVRMLASELTFWHSDYEVLNTGIGGSRVVDLLPRWKRDCLELRPDVLTILIGINDVWHELHNQNGVAGPLFEEVYDILLREVKRELPDTRIILMGAYVMHGTATNEHWDYFHTETAIRRESARRLAEKYSADFVDLQEAFDRVQQIFPSAHWTGDGVHLTPAGHWLIAREWKKVYEA